jgi:hypothetical protein
MGKSGKSGKAAGTVDQPCCAINFVHPEEAAFPALENCKGDPSMSMLSSAIQRSTLGLHSLEQYEPLIGAATIERIAAKADRVRAMRVAHISSTFYGGGVTELLTPLTLMMNATGIETDWHLIQGTPGYFGCTKKLHNTLQGDSLDFRTLKRRSTNRSCSKMPRGFILTIATRSSCMILSLCR